MRFRPLGDLVMHWSKMVKFHRNQHPACVTQAGFLCTEANIKKHGKILLNDSGGHRGNLRSHRDAKVCETERSQEGEFYVAAYGDAGTRRTLGTVQQGSRRGNLGLGHAQQPGLPVGLLVRAVRLNLALGLQLHKLNGQ